MATLFQKRGIWYINYVVDGHRYKLSTGTKDKRFAQVKFEDMKVKLFKGEIGARNAIQQNTTISEFFQRYIKFINSNNTVDKHSDMARLRIMQDYFARKGIKYIEGINTSIVDEFRTSVLSDKKPKTVKNYLTLLKTVLNKAVEWQLIAQNPISNLKVPKIVKTFHFFSEEEIRKLISDADETLKTGIKLLVTTGMRRGELFNLRWRDVDLKAKQLRVWPYEEFSPKGKRPRAIPLSSTAFSAISELAKKRGKSEYVFRPYDGENTIYRHFSALVKQLGLKGTLHDLRHTFASHLAMAGTPIPIIKELLGHSDISTTMIYSHLSPEIHKAEIKKLPF